MAKRPQGSDFIQYDPQYPHSPPHSPRRKKARKPRQPPPAPYIAVVVELADSAPRVYASERSDGQNAILQRIRECLTRAKHPETTQAEAKAAMRMASRLMA